MIKYFPIPDGLWANLYGTKGCIDASIHRPSQRKLWRICYATCTGDVAHLQGKVVDAAGLRAIKEILSAYDQQLNPP